MVLFHKKKSEMPSDQPLKKKQKVGDVTESSDETDFMQQNGEENGLCSLTALHFSLPPNINEDDLLKKDAAISCYEKTEKTCYKNSACAENQTDIISSSSGSNKIFSSNSIYSYGGYNKSKNIESFVNPVVSAAARNDETNWFSTRTSSSASFESIVDELSGLDDFQQFLIKQCLCRVSEETLRKPFEGHHVIDDNNCVRLAMLTEWSANKILKFLSNLQLLFDIYLKQNNKGFICSRIVDICCTIARNEYNLMEQIISLCDVRNKYINFLSAKVVSSFFIIAKTDINNEWLENILNFLTLDTSTDYTKMNFALEVIKRVVEWNDVEIHILEYSAPSSSSARGPSSGAGNHHAPMSQTEEEGEEHECTSVLYSDSESYDTSSIKGLIIKSLVERWPDLITRIQQLIVQQNVESVVESQTCILTFLRLWESTISVKTNLSVMDTKPFYTHLEIFLSMLNITTLHPVIWKQLLSLFNEVLCYGSTLALQDMLPDDTCKLAHFVIRYVKDHALLDNLPYKRNDGYMVHTFAGSVVPASTTPTVMMNVDNTLLQKMVLLVLKSVALSIKETKSDSSDSSIGSDDFDYNQDMLVIGRSMRDVLKKLDIFIKTSLVHFHPETLFSELLIKLFSDQDDYLIESMVCTLDIIVGIPDRNPVFNDLISMLNPVHSFIEFLNVVGHDYEVLLGFLVSNETCFLLYLLRFLKYIRRNWSIFLTSCNESRTNQLDRTMTVLIELKEHIEVLVRDNLFPYNIEPIIRLLQVCENLYGVNEYTS